MSLKEIFIKRCLAAGIPLSAIAEFLGQTPASIWHFVKKNKVICNKINSCKTLSDLSINEKAALNDLLNFVPADLISEWLGICFRNNKCNNKKKPLPPEGKKKGLKFVT